MALASVPELDEYKEKQTARKYYRSLPKLSLCGQTVKCRHNVHCRTNSTFLRIKEKLMSEIGQEKMKR